MEKPREPDDVIAPSAIRGWFRIAEIMRTLLVLCTASFDHLVGAGEDRKRDRQAQNRSGFEIYG
jgi:hypothetical protein